MATKIRLQRHGKKGKPFFHIVVTDSRARRDGKYIERLGYYNPTTVPASIDLEIDRSLYWVQRGAEPTDTVNAILKYKGVLYKKHLYKGVEKGAFSAEEAEKIFEKWQETHHANIDHKRSKHKEERAAQVQAIISAGVAESAARKKAKEAAAAQEEETVTEEGEESTEATDTAEEPVTEQATAEETAVETTEEPVAETESTVTDEAPAAEAAATEEVAEAPAAEATSEEESAPEADEENKEEQ